MEDYISLAEFASIHGLTDSCVRQKIHRGCIKAVKHSDRSLWIKSDEPILSHVPVKHQRTCVVCGKVFECPPSDNKVTCSPECRKIHAQQTKMGHKISEESRQKISESAKGRDLSKIQVIGTKAASMSPISGPFITNQNAVDWHIVSPEGKHFYFHSLNYWLRHEGSRYFDVRDEHLLNNVSSGLCGAKRAMLGKKYGCTTYKGWKVIPDNK